MDVTACRDCELSTIRFTGRVNGASVLEALDRLTTCETWQPEFDDLWDYREVNELVVTQDEVDRVVAQVENSAMRLGEGRTAILVRSITHEAYANLLIRISKDPRRTQRTFRDYNRAIKWLQETNDSLQRNEDAACSCVPKLV